MKDLATITLSYTYFPAKGGKTHRGCDIFNGAEKSVNRVTRSRKTS